VLTGGLRAPIDCDQAFRLIATTCCDRSRLWTCELLRWVIRESALPRYRPMRRLGSRLCLRGRSHEGSQRITHGLLHLVLGRAIEGEVVDHPADHNASLHQTAANTATATA